MGLLRFGAQTLNVEAIPDGHTVIPDSELANLRNAQNSYLSLKASIPVGVDSSQLSTLVEKGQRFDSAEKLRGEAEKKVSDLEKSLTNYSNLPKEFKVEKWNEFVQKEQTEKRNTKIGELTKKVYAAVKEKNKVDIAVDERFLPSELVKSFDPFSDKAEEEWFKIVEQGYDAQSEFVKKQTNDFVPTGEQVGSGVPPSGSVRQPIDPRFAGASGDQVSEAGGKVRTFIH